MGGGWQGKKRGGRKRSAQCPVTLGNCDLGAVSVCSNQVAGGDIEVLADTRRQKRSGISTPLPDSGLRTNLTREPGAPLGVQAEAQNSGCGPTQGSLAHAHSVLGCDLHSGLPGATTDTQGGDGHLKQQTGPCVCSPASRIHSPTATYQYGHWDIPVRL